MHAGVRTAVLALCLVTAGCGGLVGSQPPASQPTLTPAPVPEAPPDAVAPGLSEDGVHDADALVRAHVDRLSNTSYTVAHRRTVDDTEGRRLVEQVTRAEISAQYQSYTAIRTLAGPSVTDREIRASSDDRRSIQWIMGDGTNSSKIVADGRGSSGATNASREGLFFEPTYDERIRALFLGANVTSVSPATQEIAPYDGPTMLRVTATGATDPEQFPVEPAERVSDVAFTATVTSEGFVRSYSVEYTVVHDGARRHVTESLWYSAVGATEPTLDD